VETACKLVSAFHKSAKIKNGFTDDNLAFRMSLVAEEFVELAEAAGDLAGRDICSFEERIVLKEKMLKELADCVYVLVGTAVQFDWDLPEAFQRVQTSNLTKLTKMTKDEKGKVNKGPNYISPDMEGLV